MIEVNTVSVCKSLVLSMKEIDFGEVAVGIREIRDLTITNKSELPATLKMDLLPLYSGFNVINALRTLDPIKKDQVT